MARNIILLRGLARGQLHWGDFLTKMQNHFAGDNIITIDLPGNGIRHEEETPEHLDQAVEDLRQVLLRDNIKPPYYMLSLSLGGMLTFHWMKQHDDINKAIIINTSHARLAPWKRMRPLAIIKLLASLLLPVSVRESMVFSLTANRKKEPAIIRQWIDIERQHPVSKRNFFRQLLLARQFDDDLTGLTQKVLLLGSKKDRLVNFECSRSIAKQWKLPLISHPNAGHDLPLDDPEWVIEQSDRFFNQ